MRLFNTVSIETSARCDRTCWFCPNATNKRPDEFMSGELLEKLICELGAMDYAGRVELYSYNEPLKDARLGEIIRDLRATVPKCCIMIATNGDYVKNAQRFQELFDAGLNQLQINVYSNMNRFRKLQKFIESTTAEVGNIYSKQSPKKQFYSIEQKFDRLITPESPKVGRFELSNRSGNVPGLQVPLEPLQRLCTRPFRFMQVNWKGEVVLCCNDYHGVVICGDANIKTLRNIWEKSRVLQIYRTKLLQKDRGGLPLCAPCSFKGGSYPHMVTKFWTELLTKEQQELLNTK